MVGRFLTIGRACVAFLAIYIAVVSRIPTSHCRCHEKKPVEQTTKSKCPFGELRLLAQFTLLAGTIEAPEPPAMVRVVTDLAPESYLAPRESSHDARAPPQGVFSRNVA